MGRRMLAAAAMAWILAVGMTMAQKSNSLPAVAAAPAELAVPEPARELTLLELLQKGGPVMYPLYLCSIILVAFTIERAVSLRRRRVSPPETIVKLRSAMSDTPGSFNIRDLLEDMMMMNNPLARIAAAGLRRADRPVIEVEKAIEDAAAKEVTRLQRNNRVLSSIASVAPLLGLLGTVTGIIRTFMTVAAHEEALGRTEILAGGIYEALVATAVGLTIAIAALILYYYFQERVDRLVAEIDDIATELVDKLSVKL
jgi:biopolymer transport protein ExbB